MRMIVYFILLVFLIGCASSSVQENLIKSMAELDEVYIPALVFSNLLRQRETELAFERFKEKWDKFYNKYHAVEIKYGVDITDNYWSGDFERANAHVLSAEGFVEQGHLFFTHESLEGVRKILSELRQRNGMVYFLDGMIEFHGYMDEIILYLRGKDEIRDRDLKELRALFKKLQTSWAKVAQIEVDPDVFCFEADKIKAIEERVKIQEKRIAAFAASFSSGDSNRIFQSAQDLKPNFIVLYKAFGDFQPIFDQVIEERRKREAEEKE